MNQSSLGSTISALRIKNNFTQKELAEHCHVDIRTIQRIESGEVIPRKHTLRLLSNVLGEDITYHVNYPEHGNLNKQLKFSFSMAAVFSVNYIPAIYGIVSGSFHPAILTITLLIYIITCIPLCRGFYQLAKCSGNQLLEISELLAMILLPLHTVIYLLNTYYLFVSFSSTLFILVCITAVFSGVGMIIQGQSGKNIFKMSLYRTAGVMTILQSILVMSSLPDLVTTGVFISVLCNIVMTVILYREYRGWEKPVKGDVAFSA